MKYVFGPVHSRRLGLSLGIDIIPYKVCSFNCIYCECGATTELTEEVKEYFPYHEIVDEIKSVLDRKPELDVITFSGSGEPTLNSRIGDIIDFIRSNYPGYRIAVLTNSSLLHIAQVRERILNADIIYPSLDAVSPDVFNTIMRPVGGTDPVRIIESLVLRRSEFKGELCLEIFIIHGINDTDDELAKLKMACIKIAPDEIHLNQLDRPGAEEWVGAATEENMLRIKSYLHPLSVRIIARASGAPRHTDYLERFERQLLDAIRPDGSTAEELSESLDIRKFEVLKVLRKLLQHGNIKKSSEGTGEKYFIQRS